MPAKGTEKKKISKAAKPESKKPSSKRIAELAPVEISEESDADDGGVNEEGMASLMKALGDDGLDDFDRAQLVGLGSDGEEGADIEESAEDREEVEEEEEESQDDGEQDVEDELALDEVDDVDEDAVARQKIVLNNEAGSVKSSYSHSPLLDCS